MKFYFDVWAWAHHLGCLQCIFPESTCWGEPKSSRKQLNCCQGWGKSCENYGVLMVSRNTITITTPGSGWVTPTGRISTPIMSVPFLRIRAAALHSSKTYVHGLFWQSPFQHYIDQTWSGLMRADHSAVIKFIINIVSIWRHRRSEPRCLEQKGTTMCGQVWKLNEWWILSTFWTTKHLAIGQNRARSDCSGGSKWQQSDIRSELNLWWSSVMNETM